MAESVDLTIDGFPFVCTRLKDANFIDIAAVYVIICVVQGGAWSVIDIGQSGRVGSRIDDHDRRECWSRKCPGGNIWVCTYPMPTRQYTEQDRLNFEHKLRGLHINLCGSF